MHKRKAEVIVDENADVHHHRKKAKTNSGAIVKPKVSRASFVASLVGYDSKTKPTFSVGSKKVSLDFIKHDKPQPNPVPQAKYIDINPALLEANKNNNKTNSKRSNQHPRDVTVNAWKKHLQIKGSVQTAGTIQKLRKTLCDWDQSQKQPQARHVDDIISSPMLPPAPKQPRKVIVKRTEAFVFDSPFPPKRPNEEKTENSIINTNDDSIYYGEFDEYEGNQEFAENDEFAETFASPFIYQSTMATENLSNSSHNSLRNSKDDLNSSPIHLTMSFNNQTQKNQGTQTTANSILDRSYDCLNSSPFVYNPTQATPGMTSASSRHRNFATKGSRISQLMDSQKLTMSSPFIYIETQSESVDNLNKSNDNIDRNYRNIEEITTQTESSENSNFSSSPFIYLTAPSTNVNLTQKTNVNKNNSQKHVHKEEEPIKNENSEPSQKSKLSQQSQQSDFNCSPDLFATQHK